MKNKTIKNHAVAFEALRCLFSVEGPLPESSKQIGNECLQLLELEFARLSEIEKAAHERMILRGVGQILAGGRLNAALKKLAILRAENEVQL